MLIRDNKVPDHVLESRANLTPEDYEYLTISQLTQLGMKYSYNVLSYRIRVLQMSHYDAATTPPMARFKTVDETTLKSPADYEKLALVTLTRIGLKHPIGTIATRLKNGWTKYDAATKPTLRKPSKLMAEVDPIPSQECEKEPLFPFDKNATPERRLAAMHWR